ncbi:MAG: carbamoyl phosphate synthase small subunit [Candidatus Syntrophoarchaeum caldarius]|uniref:Carbamoyl phosphate synthase small chain n=1 Tax=Candidatus Syntropharchaeum caldarium TaxID=1838285 RepID=A0A1F2PCZ6_9EURY|nr:MAG: carbamoyl phosphate synthase small subunit [Candidatus Syntrophoarchaeum caldarius]
MDAVIGLEDGTTVYGEGFGIEGVVCGELVFTTQFTGYEEALTDPSYSGQILMFAYPLIGNYGLNPDTFQSERMQAEGLVVREACDHPSSHRSLNSIHDFLESERKPGIAGVDTRALTIKIREHGTLKACLMTGKTVDGSRAVELACREQEISELDLISRVTCKRMYHIEGDGKRIAVIDLGIKNNILKSLMRRKLDIFVFPADSKASDLESVNPDLLLLSNGPGDPKQAKAAIRLVSELAGSLPIAGICLGHQVIARALGADTYKLKFGHRGANQPVKNLRDGKVYITSQNHGFAVDGDSIEGTEIKITQINTNDETVEGIACPYLNIFCVQYHPEAHPGPRDTEAWFFNQIVDVIEN